MRMLNLFALTAAVVIGAGTAPAKADNGEFIRLLGGLVALGIIVEALDGDDNHRDQYRHRHGQRTPGSPHRGGLKRNQPDQYIHPRNGYRNTFSNRPGRQYQNREVRRLDRFEDTRRTNRQGRTTDMRPRHQNPPEYAESPNH